MITPRQSLNLLLIMVFLFSTVSCVDDPGCTDALATNFDPQATLNDGSCCYFEEFQLYLEEQVIDPYTAGNVALFSFDEIVFRHTPKDCGISEYETRLQIQNNSANQKTISFLYEISFQSEIGNFHENGVLDELAYGETANLGIISKKELLITDGIFSIEIDTIYYSD